MKKIGKRIIAGTLTGFMIMSMFGCSGKGGTVEDVFVKAATEIDKELEKEVEAEEAEIPVQLTIEQESFHVAFYLEAGESRKLGIDTDYDGELEYKSSDDTVAAVDTEGTVTALKNGTATMTVLAGTEKRTANVIVRTPDAEAAEEPEEENLEEENPEEPEQTAENGSDNESSGTVGTSQTSGTNTAANTSQEGTTSNTVASGSESTTPAAPSAPATEEPAFNPADYYLDWYYIQDQVNARLKADYPNCTIGSSYVVDGVTIQSGWCAGDYEDGYEGSRWTNESMINNIYLSIKNDITAMGGTSESVCGGIGMFVTNIEVHSDGTRTAYFIEYR